ncbi:5-carboxymethyl-2-hydroxymuconate isomerase [Rhodobacter sp. SGA-6-6]|uniref:5-carboxymethyl-2-hydroxymuconate isomerase n=1 Tax=Rhodobacter sp. SGA-6-6 TaxID=2710882 RepID=UPI0013EE0EBD|nr:5-carboxymethyl-2-hydroxymuconate isomerase [Rhodobacter sp. SGA-6-6]NGM47599.1 5-carboxymethyl-2-hydroxymuconate isomerase [Rhodobacter sp. SGA-6-6]
MPHLTIEYSANLEAAGDLPGLCLALRRALLDTGLFEEGAVRVRALPCPHYAVADLLPQNAFAALVLRIGAGRGPEDKARVGRAVMAAAEAHFAALLAEPHFALSLDIVENDPALSWKTNAIHPRLRARG